jgi:hypothetical protein
MNKHKVSKEELNQLNGFVDKIQGGTSRLGELELEKHDILHGLGMVRNDLNVFQNNLKEKYGDVKVDLRTGKLKSNIIE